VAKGSDYEREVCTTLSRWWTDGKRDDIFWRSAGSGARATVRGKRGKQTANQHGDVAAVDPIGAPLTDLFSIEIKRGYSSSTIHDLLDRKDKSAELLYDEWFCKAIDSCKSAGTFSWLLISRRDRREPIIWMPDEVRVVFQVVGVHFVFSPYTNMIVRLRRKNVRFCLHVFGLRLDDFLRNVTRQEILELQKIA